MELGHNIRLDVISVEHAYPPFHNINKNNVDYKKWLSFFIFTTDRNTMFFSGFAMVTYLKQSWMQSTTPIIFISIYNYTTGNLFVSL